MIRTTFATAFVLMTCAIAFGGCQPETNEEVTDTASNVASSNDAPTPSADTEPATPTAVSDAGSDPNTISGDLSSVDWKSMVGQEVTITGELIVLDTYNLSRRGQVVVARDRLYVPTNSVDPNDADASKNSFEGGSNVAKVVAAQKLNDGATLIIDDGSKKENIFPFKLFPKVGSKYPSLRVGSKLNGVTGKLVKDRRNIVLVPDGPLDWTPAKRPQRPEVGDAKVTVASFNVLNYFTTIDNGRNGARGADNKSEFKRQEAKIVSAILQLNADVVGLMEIENNVEAEKRLVTALNEAAGKELFAGCGLPEGFGDAPGGNNAIRVGIIYRTDAVAPIGGVAMINDAAFDEARVPVVQSFKPIGDVEPFTVVVNHFKSKGGSNRADEANKNKGDGQGAYNARRRNQALAICDFVQKQSDDSRILVIGDLNAYAEEDPIDAMRAKGLIDLHASNGGGQSANGAEQDYSFIYFGQSGSLDHAMATASLAEDVTGIATWHINADEPRFLDYNQEFKPKGLFKADPFRSSDHDPVLIGIGE